MSIALQRSNGDLIWFDAILSYDRSYTSTVSKHPIESGATVVDNVTQENPRFSVNGVISNADFNTTRPIINSADAKAYGMSDRRIYNSQPIPDGSAPVIGKGASSLLKYLPSSVSQFTGVQPPSVEVPDNQRPDWVFEVEDILTQIERNHELITILDFDFNGNVRRNIDDCYVNNVTFNETPETGDSFDVTMDIEQVTFVTLVETKLSGKTSSTVSKEAENKKNKGDVPSTETAAADDVKNAKEEPAPLKVLTGYGDTTTETRFDPTSKTKTVPTPTSTSSQDPFGKGTQ